MAVGRVFGGFGGLCSVLLPTTATLSREKRARATGLELERERGEERTAKVSLIPGNRIQRRARDEAEEEEGDESAVIYHGGG